MPRLLLSFAAAKSTYDRCVDLMGQISGNVPVAIVDGCDGVLDRDFKSVTMKRMSIWPKASQGKPPKFWP